MANFEVWGRREIGKGKRRKLAYGIATEAAAKRVCKEFIAKGYLDCVCGRTQDRYDAGAGIAKRLGDKHRQELRESRAAAARKYAGQVNRLPPHLW
jgi:hypothetical protein